MPYTLPAATRPLMKSLRLLLAAGALALSQPLLAASLDTPESAGLVDAGGGVYVDPALPAARQARIPAMLAEARARVEAWYGPMQARPRVVFCGSAACYEGFGAVGLGYTNGRDLVISPAGFRPAILAHELAHVELASRLGGFSRVLEAVPQWFDEGLAVVLSQDTGYSEQAWKVATRDGRDAPELARLSSLWDWNRLTGRRGERMQFTYGTAKREVERWLARAGRDGLARLLAALRKDADFTLAYRQAEARATALAGASPL